MLRQKKVVKVVGRDVLTDDGAWQHIIGNNAVFPGNFVWADGKVVYGNLMQRGVTSPAVFTDKYVLPLMTNSIGEKNQTVEYYIDLPSLNEVYPYTFFPREGNKGAFACTSNFYLTTTHDNLLDFCIADTTEQNPPPARLVNAIKQGTIDEYCETSSYTLHNVDYHDVGNYTWMGRYCKEYTQIQRNDRVDVQSVPTEVIRDEEHVVYHNVKEFELGETETGSQSASVITDDKAVIKIRGTDGVVDINQRILDTYGKELKDILEKDYELKQPSITEIKTDVVDGRINNDGYWMIRVKSKLFVAAYFSWKYDDSYTTVKEKHLDIVTKLVDVGLGLKAWYSKLVNGTEISFEKMDFQGDIPFIYQETLDFLMDSNGNFTMLKREISNLKSDTTGEKVENNIDIPVHGEWVEKGEAAPSLKADEYMKVEDRCSDGEIEIYLNGLEAEYKREVIREQKNYEYRRIYRHVDKNIYLVLENKDGMVIDLPLGKGNTARLAVHPDNEKYPFSIVMMYDAQGNEYNDMAGWALDCLGFFDMEVWRSNVFFLKAFVGETSKRREAYAYSRQDDGNYHYLTSHDAQLTSRIAIMKKRDLKNGALVDWS